MTTTIENGQVRQFTMARNLLSTVIHAQAGSLSKALSEAVMNSVDSGSKSVRLTLTTEGVTISDDGKGIRTEQELDEYFDCFGTAHKEGDSKFGYFRVGRGQLFSYGYNEWKTNNFHMVVDIKHSADFNYVLHTLQNKVKGCEISIKLYQRLSQIELEHELRQLRKMVKYIPIRVFINDERASVSLNRVKWTHEDEKAYYLIKPMRNEGESLELYNLGAFVRELPRYEYGASGVVVTKVALTLNSARNEVLYTKCAHMPVLQCTIRTVMLRAFSETTTKALTQANRSFLGETLVKEYQWGSQPDFPIPDAIFDKKLVKDAFGKLISINELLAVHTIAVSDEKNEKYAQSVQREGRAVVLSLDSLRVLELCEGSPGADKLHRILRNIVRGVKMPGTTVPNVLTVKELRKGLRAESEVVADDDVPFQGNSVLWAMLRTLRAAQTPFAAFLQDIKACSGPRKILFGDSECSLAWTDGCSYIAVSRKFMLKCAEEGLVGFVRLAHVLVHEYCHETNDDESHEHDVVFYTACHDALVHHTDAWQMFASSMYKHFLHLLEHKDYPLWEIPRYRAADAPRCAITFKALAADKAAKKTVISVLEANASSVEAHTSLVFALEGKNGMSKAEREFRERQTCLF